MIHEFELRREGDREWIGYFAAFGWSDPGNPIKQFVEVERVIHAEDGAQERIGTKTVDLGTAFVARQYRFEYKHRLRTLEQSKASLFNEVIVEGEIDPRQHRPYSVTVFKRIDRINTAPMPVCVTEEDEDRWCGRKDDDGTYTIHGDIGLPYHTGYVLSTLRQQARCALNLEDFSNQAKLSRDIIDRRRGQRALEFFPFIARKAHVVLDDDGREWKKKHPSPCKPNRQGKTLDPEGQLLGRALLEHLASRDTLRPLKEFYNTIRS
jgi:hypothetical protein